MIKGGDYNEKEREKPELEVLDVKMTMLGKDGEYTDAAFPDNTPKGKVTFSYIKNEKVIRWMILSYQNLFGFCSYYVDY